MRRDDHIHEEALALWRELFREPPPAKVGGAALLDLIMRKMPDTAYERLRTPHLRPANIVMPKEA